jgi:glycosyltransferase involved in cell wall biosynthesis
MFDRIIVNSFDVEQRYQGYPDRYRAKLVRIDHGFDIKKSISGKDQARRRFRLPTDAVILGSVGRLHLQKQPGAAVRLLSCDPSWHLALCGEGSEREPLEDLAASLGVGDRLHFLGEVHPDEVGEFLACLDVFVFPAASESFGLAVVEAAQAGVPVVANDIAVLREVLDVDGNPCALFANANDTAAFAACVRRLLENAGLRQLLTSSGRLLDRRFSLDRMIDGYDALITDLVAARSDTNGNRRQFE